MTGLSVLLLGIGLGLRHATDADHVVVISALVQRESGTWRAARLALLWGAGHSVSFMTLGLLIVLFGVQLPEQFEHYVEYLVAAMLIGFGLWHLLRRKPTPALAAKTAAASVRPLAIGMVHGLAGSAGIALIATTTIDSRPLAAAYLVLVALGTVIGMVALTALMARPMGWTTRNNGRLNTVVTFVAAALSVALGVSILLGG